jgi:hypothetical protein
MRKLLVAALVATSFTASALPNDSDETKAALDLYCVKVAGVAKSIMKSRQGGLSMVRMMELSGDNDYVKLMVKDAYSYPKYNMIDVITEFESSWYLHCLRHK